MWWHADFPAALAPGSTPDIPPDESRGEFLLDWMIPSIEDELRARGPDVADGGDGSGRRAFRRDLRED